MSKGLLKHREAQPDMTVQMDTTASQKIREMAGVKQACFLVLGGMDLGKLLPMKGDSVTIGRDPTCDLVLRDDGISRFHAAAKRSGSDCVIVRDLESTNGMYFRGQKVTEAKLRDGEKVILGRRTILKYVMEDEMEQSYQKKMYESSTRDSLTGAFNRRYFVQKIVADVSFAKRHNIPFSLLILDVDHFKKVNDTHGHLIGDQVLVAVTQAIADAIRTEDLLARYGGEEFAIIAQGTDLAGGRALAERIREQVAKTEVASDVRNQYVRVTASLGVVAVPAGFATNPEAVVSTADKNLYQAKERGRNTIVASELV